MEERDCEPSRRKGIRKQSISISLSLSTKKVLGSCDSIKLKLLPSLFCMAAGKNNEIRSFSVRVDLFLKKKKKEEGNGIH